MDLSTGAENNSDGRGFTRLGVYIQNRKRNNLAAWQRSCRWARVQPLWDDMQTWIQSKAQMKTATHGAKARVFFFVDYDITVAHVSLCHTANCNNGSLRVCPILGLATNSCENLQRARVITASLLCVFSVSTPLSSAVFQSSPESDITERTSAPATTQCYILRLVGVPFPHYTAFELKTYW